MNPKFMIYPDILHGYDLRQEPGVNGAFGMQTGRSNCDGFGMRNIRGPTLVLVLLGVSVFGLTMRWMARAALPTHVTDTGQESDPKPIPLYFPSRGIRAI